jgi:arginine:agmatine antiporter
MSDPTRKMSLVQATMLVAGNMIGTGVFLLPVNLASVGGISVFGWIVATAGAAALGLVFAKLESSTLRRRALRLRPDFLGPYVGFQTNYVYWFGNWIGNIAIAIAAVGYLAEFIPRISTPPASVFATAGVIWLLTFANIRGPRVVGWLETWTMSLALIPILGIAFLGWIWFNPEIFRGGWNVSGGSNAHAITPRRVDRALGLHGHRERRGLRGCH